MPEAEQNTSIELQQRPSLDRSSSSSASSYKTAYAQSFVSSLSTDDVTAPGGAGLGSARPSSDTDISLAGIVHENPGTLSDRARYSGMDTSAAGEADRRTGLTPDKAQHVYHTDAPGMESTDIADAQASSTRSSAEGDRNTAYRHLNGYGPQLNGEASGEGEYLSDIFTSDWVKLGVVCGEDVHIIGS